MEKIEHLGISACEADFDSANLQYYMTSQILNGDAYVMFLEYCKGIYRDYNHKNVSFEPIKRVIKKALVELKAKVQIQDMLYDDSLRRKSILEQEYEVARKAANKKLLQNLQT